MHGKNPQPMEGLPDFQGLMRHCVCRLRKLGITPRTNNEASGSFSNVVFSAPPSGGEDFVGDIRKALTMWNGEGSFVYTSSTAVYSPPKDSVKLTEDSNLESSGKSEKTDRLLQAESTVLAVSASAKLKHCIQSGFTAVAEIHINQGASCGQATALITNHECGKRNLISSTFMTCMLHCPSCMKSESSDGFALLLKYGSFVLE